MFNAPQQNNIMPTNSEINISQPEYHSPNDNKTTIKPQYIMHAIYNDMEFAYISTIPIYYWLSHHAICGALPI